MIVSKNKPVGSNRTGGKANNHGKYNNFLTTQRTRLLKWLENGEHLSTFECRRRGIMHPGARILELRQRGYQIVTHRVWEKDANNIEHKFGQYFLLSAPKRRIAT